MQVASSSSSLALASQETTKPSPFLNLLDHGDDSELDVREVPDMAGRVATSSAVGSERNHNGRKRKAVPAEKENNRMKRLLRNRVSAQQARERKKAYLSDLETRIKEIEQRNAELEEKLSTLQQENSMLRKIIKSTSIRSDNVNGVS